MIFVLEGLPGAGKTTVKNLLHNDPYWKDSIFLPEIVDQKMLEKYLSDMKSNAFSFQTEMQKKTIARMKAAAILANEGYNVFIDRGMKGNYYFTKAQHDSGFINDKEFEEYEKEFNLTNLRRFTYHDMKMLNDVSIKHVYIKVKPEIALKRIGKRSRGGENSYTLEYLQMLEKYHAKMENDGSIVIENNKTIIDELPDPNNISKTLKSSIG